MCSDIHIFSFCLFVWSLSLPHTRTGWCYPVSYIGIYESNRETNLTGQSKLSFWITWLLCGTAWWRAFTVFARGLRKISWLTTEVLSDHVPLNRESTCAWMIWMTNFVIKTYMFKWPTRVAHKGPAFGISFEILSEIFWGTSTRPI